MLDRVVVEGKIITAAGVSAGIDMALTLAARVAGDEVAQTIELGIEYDPQRPFDAGSPAKAPALSVDYLRERSRFILTGADDEPLELREKLAPWRPVSIDIVRLNHSNSGEKRAPGRPFSLNISCWIRKSTPGFVRR